MTRLSLTGWRRLAFMTRRTTRRSWSNHYRAARRGCGFSWCPGPKVAKNRVHLDLACADVRAEAEHLAGLGARVLDEHERWVTMADPEGNEFDVTLD
jgi:hypothetical protein